MHESKTKILQDEMRGKRKLQEHIQQTPFFLANFRPIERFLLLKNADILKNFEIQA